MSTIAAAIGDPARARMLYCLMDGRARTSTELAVVAGVSPSTASAHLNRLRRARLVRLLIQGRHHYYSVQSVQVASALEGLSVLASDGGDELVTRAPKRLRAARTCYDHVAGALGVQLHDRFEALGWLTARAPVDGGDYEVTPGGRAGFEALGIDVGAARAERRRFACGCLDWSERRLHLGGALGAALLEVLLQRQWVGQDLDSRALAISGEGRRQFAARLGLRL